MLLVELDLLLEHVDLGAQARIAYAGLGHGDIYYGVGRDDFGLRVETGGVAQREAAEVGSVGCLVEVVVYLAASAAYLQQVVVGSHACTDGHGCLVV